MKIAFVPMGPACLSAGILKAAGLRCCSYPLDWGQSGSSILQDLFRLSPASCYYRHFHQPNISFSQILARDSASTEHDYIHLEADKPLYGFPYYYNPHRPIGVSQDYFIRCISRFQKMVRNASINKIFLFAERLDTPHEKYFPDNDLHISFIQSILSQYVIGDWKCLVVSIISSTVEDFYGSPYCTQKFNNTYKVFVRFPASMPNETYHPYVLGALYKVIGSDFRAVNYNGNYCSGQKSRNSLLDCFRPWL